MMMMTMIGKKKTADDSKEIIIWVLSLSSILLIIIAGFGLYGKMTTSSGKIDLSVKNNSIILSSPNAENPVIVDYFEDPMCPHCASINLTNNKQMKEAVAEGKIEVRYHLLNFLDNSIGEPLSSYAGQSLILAAKTGDFDLYNNFHQEILNNQIKIRNESWGKEDFSKLARETGFGGEVPLAIKELGDGDDIVEMNNESEKVLALYGESISTPKVIANGEKITLEQDKTGTYHPWVDKAVDSNNKENNE